MGELYPESETLTVSFADLLSRQCGQKPAFVWFSFSTGNLVVLIHCWVDSLGRLFRDHGAEVPRAPCTVGEDVLLDLT